MTSALSPARRRIAALLALVALVGAGACSERLDGGAACPSLCPTGNAAVRDTLLDAISLDSTVAGFPVPGEPTTLLLAVRPSPDTLDVRAVLRFDSLPGRYFPPSGGDSLPILRVDSTRVTLRLDTAGTRFTRPVTIEAYDVDTAASVDTASAVLATLFTPARRLGAVTLQPGVALADTLLLRLPDSALVRRTQGTRRLRLGLRITSAAAATVRIRSAQGGTSAEGARLSFDAVPDTTYAPIVLTTRSVTPALAGLAAGYVDFSFVARGSRAALGSDLVVGGAPAQRVFLRFTVPRGLADSTTIVRATLELVQRPARGVDARDTVVVRPQAVVATETITDLRRAAALVANASAVVIDSLTLAPADSGQRIVSLVALVRAWRSFPAGTQRAVVLRAAREGSQAGEVRFFSSEAASGLRPRLRISYIPRTDFGLP